MSNFGCNCKEKNQRQTNNKKKLYEQRGFDKEIRPGRYEYSI